VKIGFSQPGKPTDNAYVESFNRTLRAECVDAHWHMDLGEARQQIDPWSSRGADAERICKTDRS